MNERPTTRSILEDIATILDYNWEDERDDYEACRNGSGNENGTFPTLVRIRNWLDGTDAKPDDFIRIAVD